MARIEISENLVITDKESEMWVDFEEFLKDLQKQAVRGGAVYNVVDNALNDLFYLGEFIL